MTNLVRTCLRRSGAGVAFLLWTLPACAADAQTCDANSAFGRARQLIDSKQFNEATNELDHFRACPSRSPLESFQLGWMYGRARRFDTALKVFETVPPDVPDPSTHDYAIALSDFELERFQAAVEVLKRYQTSSTADAKTANLLAVSYSKLGQYRDAYNVLSAQLQRPAADVTTYLNLVTVCAEGGDVPKAADVGLAAERAFPDSADVKVVLGAAHTMLGHLDQASDDFSQAAHIAPQRADARFFLALINYKQARYSDAIGVLRTALNDGIADSDLHYLMAECLLKADSGNTGAALQELNQAIQLNADSVAPRTLRGKLLVDAGRPADAIADLESARQRDPQSRSAIYNLARAYQATGRRSEAQSLFHTLRSENSETLSEASEVRLNGTLTGKAGQSQ